MNKIIHILPPKTPHKFAHLRAYLVGLAVVLVILQSITIHSIVKVIQTNAHPHFTTHSLAQSANKVFQQLSQAFNQYLEDHPYSSPISNTTFTSLLVLYYENTLVQLSNPPTKNTDELTDHYRNFYHFLFFPKIPHPPQNQA